MKKVFCIVSIFFFVFSAFAASMDQKVRSVPNNVTEQDQARWNLNNFRNPRHEHTAVS